MCRHFLTKTLALTGSIAHPSMSCTALAVVLSTTAIWAKIPVLRKYTKAVAGCQYDARVLTSQAAGTGLRSSPPAG